MRIKDPATRQRWSLIILPLVVADFAADGVSGHHPGRVAARAAVGFGVTLIALVVLFELLALTRGNRLPAFLPRRRPTAIPDGVAEYLPKTVWVIRNREPKLVDMFLANESLLEPKALPDTLGLSFSLALTFLKCPDPREKVTDEAILAMCMTLAPMLPVPVSRDAFAQRLADLRSPKPAGLTRLADLTLPVLCEVLTIPAAVASILELNRHQMQSRWAELADAWEHSQTVAKSRRRFD